MSATVTALRPPAKADLSRRLLEQALQQHILLGMPHLSASGISETWLMKELGHRHWCLLALAMGMDNADFRDESGRSAYAAICATSLRSIRLHLAAANDILEIQSSLHILSRTKVLSRHRVSLNNEPAAELELVSTFVIRQEGADNSTISRVRLKQFSDPVTDGHELLDIHRRLKTGAGGTHLDLQLDQPWALTFEFTPDRTEEFNGAGLFYFAYFQSLITRSDNSPTPLSSIPMRRDMFFLGNINPGEKVLIEKAGAADMHRLIRPDGKVLAIGFAIHGEPVGDEAGNPAGIGRQNWEHERAGRRCGGE